MSQKSVAPTPLRSANYPLPAAASLFDGLVSQVALEEPARLEPPGSWVEHIPFAFWMMEALQPERFVELGTHSGNSYLAFCQAGSALKQEVQCFAVDTWKGDPQAGFYGEEVFERLLAYHDRHYGHFSRLIRSTFDEARHSFATGAIEMVCSKSGVLHVPIRRNSILWYRQRQRLERD